MGIRSRFRLGRSPGTSFRTGRQPQTNLQSQIENVCNCSLEEYMQKNIWSKLGVTSTTFHPELYPDTLPPKLEMANRISVGQGTKSIKAGPVILGQPLKDDLGGIGLWSTPNDYIKLLTALLRGGEPLLTKDGLDILFRPQLSDASRAAMPLPLGSRMRSILAIKSVDEIDQADHCLAGTVTLKDIPRRRPRGTVSWSGLPNLHWVRTKPYYFASIKNPVTNSYIGGIVDRPKNGHYGCTIHSAPSTWGCSGYGFVDRLGNGTLQSYTGKGTCWSQGQAIEGKQ